MALSEEAKGFLLDAVRKSRGKELEADQGRFVDRTADVGVQKALGGTSVRGITNMGTGKIGLAPDALVTTLPHEMEHLIQKRRRGQNPMLGKDTDQKEQMLMPELRKFMVKALDLKLPGFSGDMDQGELAAQLQGYASQLPKGKPLLSTPLMQGVSPEVQRFLLQSIAERADGNTEN